MQIRIVRRGRMGPGTLPKTLDKDIKGSLMAVYAEGLNVRRAATIGKQRHGRDAETTALADPEHGLFKFDHADPAEVWWRGSAIAWRRRDLTVDACLKKSRRSNCGAWVPDCEESPLIVNGAHEETESLFTLALSSRFSARGGGDFRDTSLSAVRFDLDGLQAKSARL